MTEKIEHKTENKSRKENIKEIPVPLKEDYMADGYVPDAEKIKEIGKELEEEQKKEVKTETKVESKKEQKAKPVVKKELAIANGLDLHASKKHCMYISTFVKGKKIDDAIKQLEEVIKLKRAIPFKGEIPHRKGDMMSGRYPVNASKLYINILKGLKGNVLANGMDLDKTVITSSISNWSTRPQRRGGGRFKRTNVYITAKEIK